MATASPTRYAGAAGATQRDDPAGARGPAGRRPTWHGDAVVLLPLLVAAAALLATGLPEAPARSAAEGSVVRQAWAVTHLGDLTYPGRHVAEPFGWWQLAAWHRLTGSLTPDAVTSGRQLMAVLTVVGAVLVWALAKRLALPRWAAALALVLFVASPVALQLHRTVLVDTVATTWVLAALVLVLDPRRRLGAFTAAAACFALAVLSTLSSLLLLPVLGWWLWRRSAGESRRYVVAVALTLAGLVVALLAGVAAAGGDVLDRAGLGGMRAGLLAAALDQVLGSDTLARTGAAPHDTSALLVLAPVVGLVGVVATVLALLVRRLRPLAVGALVLLAVLLVPFRTPGPLVQLLPLAAVLVAGVVTVAWQDRPRRMAADLAVLLATIAVLVSGAAAPGWARQLQRLTGDDADRPLREATAWLGQNVPRDARVITDDAVWVDLVEQGREPADVVGFAQPGEVRGVPLDGSAYGWVVSTRTVRQDPRAFATLTEALSASRAVATFGSGADRVEVRQVVSDPPPPDPVVTDPPPPDQVVTDPPPPDQVAEQREAVRQAGEQLAGNPRLAFSPQARSAITSGRVDPRLLTVLALASGAHDLQVQALPRSDAETAAGGGFRTARITAVDGLPVTADARGVADIVSMLRSQGPAYRPDTRVVTGAGLPALEISYPVGGA